MLLKIVPPFNLPFEKRVSLSLGDMFEAEGSLSSSGLLLKESNKQRLQQNHFLLREAVEMNLLFYIH